MYKIGIKNKGTTPIITFRTSFYKIKSAYRVLFITLICRSVVFTFQNAGSNNARAQSELAKQVVFTFQNAGSNNDFM